MSVHRSTGAKAALFILLIIESSCPARRPKADRASGSAPDARSRRMVKPPPTWPAFPQTVSAGRALLARHRTRAGLPNPPYAAVIEGLFSTDAKIIAGVPAIARWIDARFEAAQRRGRRAYLLFGTHHDAAGQMRAFRRLVGRGGARTIKSVVAEQFDADGRWRTVTAEQSGDSGPLSSFFHRGDPKSFATLLAGQRRKNYTAWKYGYLEEMTALILATRASGRRLFACDMPRPLQRRCPGELADRLRELHCKLALDERRAKTPMAMIWGQSHVGGEGFVRLLPALAEVISLRVYGQRPSKGAPERALSRRLAITAPTLLLPKTSCKSSSALRCVRQAVLLLPDANLRAAVDRARDPSDKPLASPGKTALTVSSAMGGVLWISGQRVVVGRAPKTVLVGAGGGVFRFVAKKKTMHLIGELGLPNRGAVTLRLSIERREVVVVYRPWRAVQNAASGTDFLPIVK